jgi:cytochrome P450
VSAALAVVMESFVTKGERGPLAIPNAIPTPGNLRVRRAIERIDQIVYGIVRERRASGEDKPDLLSTLLHLRDDEGSGMTDKQLRDELVTLVVAGHETTAVALSWTFYLLSQHPEVEAKMVEELESVLGDRAPTTADLPRLTYTDHVLTESMRLYPPFWALGREAVTDCELGGYRIPADANILMCQWVVHRDPRLFDDPERFNPDRWADGLTKRIPRFAYFPFGGGQRLCLGKDFATMEAVLVLATAMQRFHLDLEPGFTIRPRPSLTLRPRYGMRMVLHRR